MITTSRTFSPLSAPDPFTLSYFIANASSVILILILCLLVATVFSTIVLLLLLKIFEIVSDILLETLEDDVEEGRIRNLVVESFLTYQDSLNQISGRRERVQPYMQGSEMRPIHKATSNIKLPQLVIYGQEELRPFYSNDCVICLESFITGESCQFLVPCNHLFHSYCIKHWLKDNVTCPVCRNCLLET